jgi:hypothetical protein
MALDISALLLRTRTDDAERQIPTSSQPQLRVHLLSTTEERRAREKKPHFPSQSENSHPSTHHSIAPALPQEMWTRDEDGQIHVDVTV